MGWFKNFGLFCQVNNLDHHKSGSWDAFHRSEKGLPWVKRRYIEDDIVDRALTWDEIDSLTGGACGTHHTACPYCGDGSYSAKLKLTRTLTSAWWYCYRCTTKGSVKNPHPPKGIEARRQERAERALIDARREAEREKAINIWNKCSAITTNNKSVADYLGARGLELPPNPDEVMRWHPRCPFGYDRNVPCIVSLFRNALTDEPTGIHRTHINSPSLGKAVRMVTGTMMGSAIKLWPLSGESLAIGEGIENVLAAVKLGFADPPAWAGAAANNMSILPVIPGIKRLTILADNDKDKGNGNTGVLAATTLYHSYRRSGIEAAIKMPRTVDTDFNDLLRAQA